MKINLKQKKSTNARIASYKYIKKIAWTPKKIRNQIIFLEYYIQRYQHHGNGNWVISEKFPCTEYYKELVEATKNY